VGGTVGQGDDVDIKDQAANQLVQPYDRNPAVRALVQLVLPVAGSIADTLAATAWQNIRHERMRTFFDELAKGEDDLTPELIKSEDFLHCYFATVRAATNTRRREKIRLLAQLLRSAMTGEDVASVDDYEEYLGVLDDLHFRELLILVAFDGERERRHMQGPHSEKPWLNEETLHTALNGLPDLAVSKDDLRGVLTRLSRTGCMVRVVHTGGFYTKGEESNASWQLTGTYYRLKQLLPNLAKAVGSEIQ